MSSISRFAYSVRFLAYSMRMFRGWCLAVSIPRACFEESALPCLFHASVSSKARCHVCSARVFRGRRSAARILCNLFEDGASKCVFRVNVSRKARVCAEVAAPLEAFAFFCF